MMPQLPHGSRFESSVREQALPGAPETPTEKVVGQRSLRKQLSQNKAPGEKAARTTHTEACTDCKINTAVF